MYKKISLVASMFALVALVACDKQEQAKVPSSHWVPPQTETQQSSESTHQTSSSTTYTPQAPVATPHADLPDECSVNPVAMVKEDQTSIQCSCRGATTEARWTSVKSKDPSVKNDCMSGLYVYWQVMHLPIRGPRAIDILAGTATPVSQAPAPATPVASATPATTGAPVAVPAPTVTAQAPVAAAPTKDNTVKSTTVDQENKYKIVYECTSGEVAKRSVVAKDNSNSREVQTCGGKTLVCLKDRSAQQDLLSPPCSCFKGSPRQSFGSVWMCD